MSGVIPQVAALMGPCAAGTAYIPGLADFVPMVKGRGSMALAGPHLVRAAVGEDVTQEELGGSRVHCRKSGRRRPRGRLRRGVHRARSSSTCRSCPQHCEERRRCGPARPGRPHGRGAARRAARVQPQAVRHVRGDPPDRRRRRVVRHQAAVGEDDHHLPRAHGRAAGRDRRQPAQAARRHPRQRLRRQGRALRQPLQRVRDPARVPDGRARASWSARRSRQAGIIRHGAKMLYAVANATVPKITVVLRKAYGAGYYVMNGRAYEPDLIVAWPSAEISRDGRRGRGRDRLPQAGRGGRRPGGQEGRADRGLPQDHRRLHRGEQRHDRRRHRPARDAPDDHPRARDGRGQARRAALEAPRSRAGGSGTSHFPPWSERP